MTGSPADTASQAGLLESELSHLALAPEAAPSTSPEAARVRVHAFSHGYSSPCTRTVMAEQKVALQPWATGGWEKDTVVNATAAQSEVAPGLATVTTARLTDAGAVQDGKLRTCATITRGSLYRSSQ